MAFQAAADRQAEAMGVEDAQLLREAEREIVRVDLLVGEPTVSTARLEKAHERPRKPRC